MTPRYLVQGRTSRGEWRTVYRTETEAHAFVRVDDVHTEQAFTRGPHGRHVVAKYSAVRIALGGEVLARWHDGRRVWPARDAHTQLGLLEVAS